MQGFHGPDRMKHLIHNEYPTQSTHRQIPSFLSQFDAETETRHGWHQADMHLTSREYYQETVPIKTRPRQIQRNQIDYHEHMLTSCGFPDRTRRLEIERFRRRGWYKSNIHN